MSAVIIIIPMQGSYSMINLLVMYFTVSAANRNNRIINIRHGEKWLQYLNERYELIYNQNENLELRRCLSSERFVIVKFRLATGYLSQGNFGSSLVDKTFFRSMYIKYTRDAPIILTFINLIVLCSMLLQREIQPNVAAH